MKKQFKDKTVLVTGGTGSIGSEIVSQLLLSDVRQIRVFSRDETKQFELAHKLNGNPRIRLLVGDIRDKERLRMAIENTDIVFHAAALKHVVSCELNPFEAVKTNVTGTQNIIECALANDIEKVLSVSTDKAADTTIGNANVVCIIKHDKQPIKKVINFKSMNLVIRRTS